MIGLWIAAASSVIVATILFVFAHYLTSYYGYPFYTFGSIFLALGVTLSAMNVLKNPIALVALFATLAIFFIAGNQYNFLNLRGVL